MTLAVNVHVPDHSRKPPTTAPEQLPLTGKALEYARELYRREVAKPARARGRVHRHLRLVSGQISANPARGNRVARQAIAAFEEEVARGRKADWSGSREQALVAFSRSLAAHGRLPSLRSWREALRVLAASTGLVVLRGRTVEIRFGAAKADAPRDTVQQTLKIGAAGCDIATGAVSGEAVEAVSGCDKDPGFEASTGFELRSAYKGTHARVTMEDPWLGSFSEWVQQCGRLKWTRAASILMVRSGDLRGSVRDAARQLFDKAKGKASTGGRRYVLRGASQAAPLWPKHLGRQTVLRGLERALVRMVEEGLIRREGETWAVPKAWSDNAALASRGLEEHALVVPSPPSDRMQAHLRSKGLESPETLTAPEAKAIAGRIYSAAEAKAMTEPHRVRPVEPTYEPESIARPEHSDAIRVLFRVAAEKGLRVGPQQHVDALDAVLRKERDAISDPSHEGGFLWKGLLEKALANQPGVLGPYMLAVMTQRSEARERAAAEALLREAPMQRVKATIHRDIKPANPPAYMAPEQTKSTVRTTPLRPWEVAAEERARGWGRRKESAA